MSGFVTAIEKGIESLGILAEENPTLSQALKFGGFGAGSLGAAFEDNPVEAATALLIGAGTVVLLAPELATVALGVEASELGVALAEVVGDRYAGAASKLFVDFVAAQLGENVFSAAYDDYLAGLKIAFADSGLNQQTSSVSPTPAPTPMPTPLPTPSQTGVYYLIEGGGNVINSFNTANSQQAAYEIDPSLNVSLGDIQYLPGLGLIGIGHIAGMVGNTIFKLIPTTTPVLDENTGVDDAHTPALYGYHSYALDVQALSNIPDTVGGLSTDSSGGLIGLNSPATNDTIKPVEVVSIDPLSGAITPIETLQPNGTNSEITGFADVNGTIYLSEPGEIVKYTSPDSSAAFQTGPIPGLPTGATTSGITNSDGTLVSFGAGVFAIDPNTGALTVINDTPSAGIESSDLFEGSSAIDGTYVDAGATNLTTVYTPPDATTPTPTPVVSGFDGDQVRFDTYYPDIAPENLLETGTTTVVPGTTTYLNSGDSSAGTPTSDMFRLDSGTDYISGNTITFLESAANEGGVFSSGAFNGSVITDLNQNSPVITGLTLESTNIPGLTRDDFSFTDHSIARNLQGLTLPSDVQGSTVISVQFASIPSADALFLHQTG